MTVSNSNQQSSTIVEFIKSQIDITDLISKYVDLNGTSKVKKGLCPFYPEKTPSFIVYPETQTFKCFCGSCAGFSGGDIYTFMMRVENVDFKEALQKCAEVAGVSLQKNNNNKLNIKGTIFNTKYNLNINRSIENLYQTNFDLRFSQLNTNIKNILTKDANNNNDYIGKTYITFSGSEININYGIRDKIILFNSFKSTLNKKNIDFKGMINNSPFNFDIYIDLKKINLLKLVKNLSEIKNLFNSKIFFHNNFNGKILVNIDSLSNIKLFDQAKIYLKFVNGKLIINDTALISNKIGKLKFIESKLLEINNEQIIKAKILFNITDQKKFYQLFQVPKNNRMELNNIYVEVEKNLNIDGIEINKFVINSKTKKNPSNKSFDLTEKIDFSEIYNLKNWIEVKKFSNQLFSKIN